MWLAGAAGFAFVGAGVATEESVAVIGGFLGLGVGLVLVGLGIRKPSPVLALLGSLVGLGGMLPFAVRMIVPFEMSPYYGPLTLYLAGLVALVVMTIRSLASQVVLGPVFQVVVGALWIAAGALWVALDLDGGMVWQPGNVLTLIGGILLVFGKARTTRAT